LCDEIATLLSEQNKKYRFHAFTSEEHRDRQIATLLYHVRKDNGDAVEEPMGVEELPNSDEIPLTQVYSLLCKYTEAKRNGDEKFQSFESDIKGHGFKIIPAIDKFLAQSQNSAEKDIMKALARQMAFKIQSITIIGNTTGPLDALLAPLRQMHDFSYLAVLQVARNIAAVEIEYPVYIQYSRFKDEIGVNLRVEIGDTKMTRVNVQNTLVTNVTTRITSGSYNPPHFLSTATREYTDAIDEITYRTPFVGFFWFAERF
jgi:hypothetical protein